MSWMPLCFTCKYLTS
uniref:Uncharacterized protein n=1 Tax=Rhizophora mucronata TaxID=61149 RepID=A0A2P2LN75_RHIMU